MYQVQGSSAIMRARRELFGGRLRVSRVVVLLGMTSLFTDISSEMVATVLPLYLVFASGLSPLAFGVIDGIYNGAAALIRPVGGILGDRLGRHKAVAVAGYGLSLLCRPLLLLSGGSTALIGLAVGLDRTGKGLRTAPRDALISLSTPRERLGEAFGVHRALDTAGAMLGPVLAFVILAAAPGDYLAVFAVSLFAAAIGLGFITLFVDDRRAPAPEAEAIERPVQVSIKAAFGLMKDPRLRSLGLVAALLGLTTISDAFLYLGLQRHLDLQISFFPLLFAGTSLVYMLLAAPVGRLADRIGRRVVFISGFVLLLVVYSSLLLPSFGTFMVFVYLAAFGVYYAATDGVLAAMTSAIVPDELRGSGLSLVATAATLANLGASIIFGALWAAGSNALAVACFSVGLAVAIVFAVVMLPRGEGDEQLA